MPTALEDVMTPRILAVPAHASARDAAQAMRSADAGCVIVTGADDNRFLGILTDRDIVVRAVADGRNPLDVPVADICSRDVTFADVHDSVEQALDKMSHHAVRRLPVADAGNIAGMVSLSDLESAVHADSALATIAAAPGNT